MNSAGGRNQERSNQVLASIQVDDGIRKWSVKLMNGIPTDCFCRGVSDLGFGLCVCTAIAKVEDLSVRRQVSY